MALRSSRYFLLEERKTSYYFLAIFALLARCNAGSGGIVCFVLSSGIWWSFRYLIHDFLDMRLFTTTPDLCREQGYLEKIDLCIYPFFFIGPQEQAFFTFFLFQIVQHLYSRPLMNIFT